MHIYFIGSSAIRTEALASEAVKNGHTVTVASEKLHRIIFSCIAALSIRPDTIHVHGWKAASMLRLVLSFLPNTVALWTIPSLPSIPNTAGQLIFQRILMYIAGGFDSICTSSRTVQYLLLATYSLKSEYIPDGYNTPVLPDIRPAVFALRKEQYGVAFAQNIAQIKQISAVYKALKSTKKLVIFSKEKHAGLIQLDLPLTSRGAQSLVRQAAFIVSSHPAYSLLLLQAMDAGRTIIATTDSLHEELLGTTAQYYAENDSTQLQKLLKEAIKTRTTNTSAQLRAKNHFSWEKIGQEYMKAYRHSKAVLVPFDSIIPKNSFQRAV